MKGNLLKKFLAFSIGGYLNIIIGIFTIPIITRLFSPKEYGIYSLITSIGSMWVSISYLGLDLGFMRFFYDEKEENRGRLLYETLYYPLFINISICLLVIFFKERISIFILGYIDKNLSLILVAYIFFSLINRFAVLVIRMQQKAKMYSFFNVFIKITDFLLILVLYKFYGNTYKVIILAIVISLGINSLLAIIAENQIWKFSGKIETGKMELLRYSFPFVFTMALNWIFTSCDRIFIKYFSSFEELGLYAGAFKIIGLLTVIQSGFYAFWAPVAYQHYSEFPKDKEFFKNVTNYLSIIFFILGIGVLFVRDIIILFLGKEYYNSIYIIPMLIFMPLMQLLCIMTEVGIVFCKKTEYFLYSSSIVAFINIIGNFLLIPSLGARGAAVSTGVSYILFFILKTYFSIKLINFNFDLKKIYIIVFLIFIYSFILTFYNNIFFTFLCGIFLEIIVLLLYLPILKEIYNKYLKNKFFINK